MATLPNWNWLKVEVNNLYEIQQELLPLIDHVIPDWSTSPATFKHIDIEYIKKLSPAYVKLLSKLNLLDRLTASAIITTQGQNTIPIHTDWVDYRIRSFAFNIPLKNCENSYTVWYKAKTPKPNTGDRSDGKDQTLFYDDEGAVEIDRMNATTCAFVNVYRPHRPITLHDNFRAILSSRFYPELWDYFE